MSAAAWRLVLLVSCAHALVHVYELSLPSVEQYVAADYVGSDVAAGKQMTGILQTTWRLPWGLGALLAGWLVDQLGSKRMLAVFLLGTAAICGMVGLFPPLPLLFVLMFSMGTLACIYHPAGLALISHNVPAPRLPLALGVHGVFGSIGIGLAPIAAGLLLAQGIEWTYYYWLLAVPGAALGSVFVWFAIRDGDASGATTKRTGVTDGEDDADWPAFFTLTCLAMMQGFIYSAVLSFLPRYLNLGFTAPTGDSTIGMAGVEGAGQGALISGGVLLVGCVGQFLSGMYARSDKLEQQLTLVSLGNIPFLLWMAGAGGGSRVVAASLFALVHFMHQPLYNSLIAKYSPRRRRSLCYGFSFAMGLGLGSFGAAFAGATLNYSVTYGTLAGVALAAGLLGGVLWRRAHRRTLAQPTDPNAHPPAP